MWTQIMQMKRKDIERKLYALRNKNHKEPPLFMLSWTQKFYELLLKYHNDPQRICREYFDYCIQEDKSIKTRLSKETFVDFMNKAFKEMNKKGDANEKSVFQKNKQSRKSRI